MSYTVWVADLSEIGVPDDFEREFPGASRSATEVTANLLQVADALISEIERPPREAFGLSVSAFQTLAILAAEPLPGHVIAEQLLVSSAGMTSLLDTLERRGLIERRPHPTDRRKNLVYLTADAQLIVDQMLPPIHTVIAHAISDLPEPDRLQFLKSLATIRARLNTIKMQPPPAPRARRKRRSPAPSRGRQS
jgi:DNA-binding MarR family transcriptional regulator